MLWYNWDRSMSWNQKLRSVVVWSPWLYCYCYDESLLCLICFTLLCSCTKMSLCFKCIFTTGSDINLDRICWKLLNHVCCDIKFKSFSYMKLELLLICMIRKQNCDSCLMFDQIMMILWRPLTRQDASV